MQQNSWFRKRDALVVSFTVPIFVMLIVFAQRQIFPFGENCYLRTDLYHQYAPFFSEFQYKLKNGGSLLYSWDVGLGVNFSAIYAYYLASPLNWAVVLFPKKWIIEFMTGMIVLKTAAAGLCMTWYLQRRYRSEAFYAGFFGIFYALSGYMCAYSWNIMWLDCILLFPLLCFGLEQLVEEERGFLYAAVLGLCIASNYYISIMICIFMVLYFLTLMVMRGVTGSALARACIRFALCSLIAGGVAAAVLLPAVFALRATASGDFSFPKTWSLYFSVIDMLARHLCGVETEVGLDHWPNIFCGTAVLQLMVLYVVNRKIPLREKASYGVLLLFFLASFSINVLNYIWHGFHYPNSLPCRQSFIYIFLVLSLCFQTLVKQEGNTKKDLKLSFLLVFVFVLLWQELIDQKHFHFAVFFAAMVLVSLYALLLWMSRDERVNKNILLLAAMGLVSVESAANLAATSVPTTSRTEYLRENREIMALKDRVWEENNFFRFERIKRKSKDDGAWMNFPSVSLFSSTARKSLSDFLRDVGCESSVNAYSITGSTPLVDALLSVRYGFYSSESFNPDLKLKDQEGDVWLYENPSVFPLGFMVNPDLEDNWMRTLENPADVQNDLCKLYGVGPVLREVSGVTEGKNFSFEAEEDGEYYVFVTNGKVDKVKADLPGDNKTFDNLKRRFFLELGRLYTGETAALRIDGEEAVGGLDAKAYRFDYDALRELKHVMVKSPLQLTSFSDREITGTVDAEDYGILLTSIPFDKGWEAEVDGRAGETAEMFGAFLGIRVPAGSHEIRLTFTPEGRTPGMALTAGSLVLLLLLFLWERKRKPKAKAALPEEEFEDLDNPVDPEAEGLAEEFEDTEETETADAARTAEAVKTANVIEAADTVQTANAAELGNAAEAESKLQESAEALPPEGPAGEGEKL